MKSKKKLPLKYTPKSDDADSCALNCVDFLRHSEILTGNNRGLMKGWDLRTDKDVPTTSIMLSETTRVSTCLTRTFLRSK